MAKRRNVKSLSEIPNAENPARKIRIDSLDVTDYMQTKYLTYAKYAVAKRAVPSLIDGFKTGARKILHAALNGSAKKGSDVKCLNLVGDVYSLSGYDHGDSSLYSTMLTLSSDFSDNLAPLFIKGQGGTLRDPDAAAAPRYLYIRLSKYTNLLYKTDYDILKFDVSEGETHEPQFYLPIIPTVLTSNTSGIGVGYAFSSMSYNPLDLIEAIRNYLAYGYITSVRPYVKGLTENARWFFTDDRWHCQGHYEIVRATKRGEKNKIVVNELTFDKTFLNIESHYDTLVDSGIIEDWVNNSRGSKIKYELYFKTDEQFEKAISDVWNLELNILKNISKVEKDNLTVMDENDKIRYFEKPEALIEYFTKFRLGKYNDRKDAMTKKINERIERINMLLKFIQLVIDSKIVLSNRSIKDVKADLDKHKILHDVLSMPISRITKEEFEKLKKESKELDAELKRLLNTSIEEMYLNDLDELEKSIQEDFLDQDELPLEIEEVEESE
ncbi:gp45 [Sphingomonas phage PAU]|uniref:gp45 n=1 Tax=Sphingomonas phage PAU TaxID=1150991 RepID=UPI0002573132|nr:gp45 [Sphingomonas phage PAU]AFF28043.1 gp45 [Sphingomonas phage PAU]